MNCVSIGMLHTFIMLICDQCFIWNHAIFNVKLKMPAKRLRKYTDLYLIQVYAVKISRK